jgi:hypothetical protein
MDAMIDAHLARQAEAAAAGVGGPRRHVSAGGRRTPWSFLPPALRRPTGGRVCVSGEANAWPVDSPEAASGDELVHWVARRVVGNGGAARVDASAEFVASPSRALCPTTPGHLELDAERLLAAPDRASLFRDWRAFLREGDVLCSWGAYSTDLFQRNGGDPGAPVIDVRAAARSLTSGKPGSIEGYARSLGIDVEATLAETPLTGRAGRRVAILAAILCAWERLREAEGG